MLTPEEIQNIIDYEIVVDCYDEYEMSSGWYETMSVKYSQLTDIVADEETMEMFEIWDYWTKRM